MEGTTEDIEGSLKIFIIVILIYLDWLNDVSFDLEKVFYGGIAGATQVKPSNVEVWLPWT